MTQLYASIVIGTAATMLAVILLLARSNLPMAALVKWWTELNSATAGVVMTLLLAAAVASYSVGQKSHTSAVNAASHYSSQDLSEAHTVASLRDYAETLDAKPPTTGATPSETAAAALPAVDMMIAKLVARLNDQPDDVKGWKMLGWTYLNTDKPQEAAKAYKAAQKLDPADAEIKKGLEAAKSAEASANQSKAPSR